MVEYLLMKLFTNQTIYTLIDMLFKDMQEDSEKYKDSEKKAIEELQKANAPP